MKSEILRVIEPKFKPFVLTITVESPEEAAMLMGRFNMPNSQVRANVGCSFSVRPLSEMAEMLVEDCDCDTSEPFDLLRDIVEDYLDKQKQ